MNWKAAEQEVGSYLRQQYSPVVKEVANYLQQGSLCLVAGARGIGKSSCLIPMLEAALGSSGSIVRTNLGDIPDGMRWRDIDREIACLHGDILILDEVGILQTKQRDPKKGLRAICDRGIPKMVGVMAHSLTKEGLNAKKELASAFQDTGRKLGTKDPLIIDLPLLRLPFDLAYNLVRAQPWQERVSDKAIELALNTIPLILEVVSNSDSFQGSRFFAIGDFEKRFGSYMTKEELAIFRSKQTEYAKRCLL